MSCTPVLALGQICGNCRGTGVLRYSWRDGLESKKTCRLCVGTGRRGRHRK